MRPQIQHLDLFGWMAHFAHYSIGGAERLYDKLKTADKASNKAHKCRELVQVTGAVHVPHCQLRVVSYSNQCRWQ